MRTREIITLTLNPAIDHILTVDSISLYNKNYVRESTTFYGGKGINTAFALGKLHARCRAVGFIGEQDIDAYRQKLSQIEVASIFISVSGITRSAFKIMAADCGKDTEFNQSGFKVAKQDLDNLTALLEELLPACSWLTISGSLPPGAPTDLYADLIARTKRAGACASLDASGEALRVGAQAQPDLLRINRSELEELCGKNLSGLLDIKTAVQEYVHSGTRMAVISLGKQGLLGCDGSRCYSVKVPQVQVVSLTGAGDTLTAGFLHALTDGKTFSQALQFGGALASASVLCKEPGDFNESDFKRTLSQTIIEKV